MKFFFLGLVVQPTAMFKSTPLWCEVCTKDNCQFLKDMKDFAPIEFKNNHSSSAYYSGWVRKYCTMTAVDDFTLYFPYVLLLIPIIMVAVEKGFKWYIDR